MRQFEHQKTAAAKIQKASRLRVSEQSTRPSEGPSKRSSFGVSDAFLRLDPRHPRSSVISAHASYKKPGQGDVEKASEPLLFWHTERGWKDAKDAMPNTATFYDPNPKGGALGRPEEVMPTAEAHPSLYPEDAQTLGTLEVEVLEARHLPSGFLSQADAYAVLLFEGCAAQTSIVMDDNNPVWSATASYRAFRFPVTHPASTLCVALMESSDYALSALVTFDDILGRASVRVSSMRNRVTYDCWFPLTPVGKPATDRDGTGELRLRYTVKFKSEPLRFLRYVAGGRTLHEVPFESFARKKSHSMGATFAYFGKEDLMEKASMMQNISRLQKNAKELASYGEGFVAALVATEDILFWRLGSIHLSVLLWVGSQLVIWYRNYFYLPAAIVLGCILKLNRTYAASRSDLGMKWRVVGPEKPKAGREIFSEGLATALLEKREFSKAQIDGFGLTEVRVDSFIKAGDNNYYEQASSALRHPDQPTFTHILASLLPPKAGEPIVTAVDSTANVTNQAKAKVGGALASAWSIVVDAIRCLPGCHEALRFAPKRKPGPLLFRPKGQLELDMLMEHAGFACKMEELDLDDEDDKGMEDKVAQATVKMLSHGVLKEGWVTKVIGSLSKVSDAITLMAILPLRRYSSLLAWEDPFVTTWLYLVLLLLFLLFCFLPIGYFLWLLADFVAAVASLVGLGPWMHFVGKRLEERVRKLKAEEEEYQSMTPRQREQKMKAYRASLVEEYSKKLKKNASRRDKQAVDDRAKFLGEHRKRGNPHMCIPSERCASRILGSAPPTAVRLPELSTTAAGSLTDASSVTQPLLAAAEHP